MPNSPKRRGVHAERVEVVRHSGTPGARWQPVVGEEALELLESLRIPPTSRAHVRDEAVQVLSKCVPPTAASGAETGLIVGYVQSGKTMSFTTVAALARDNGYQMVIVITGISVPLLDQSTDRLIRDLRLTTRTDRKWQRFTNPSQESNDRANILKTLGDWNDPDVPPEERRTVLVTVMKNVTYLNKLIALLESLPLVGRPTIVIDDEADQAGLNSAVRRGAESATYQRLRRIRAALPHHSYLQYTATPQAPLLINLIDSLSPRFANLLTPGPDYVGGLDFFVEMPALVKEIPEAEIPSSGNILHEPPATLLEALRLFFLGVAAGLVKDHGRGYRSMLVHPSRGKVDQGQYASWVQAITGRWGATLELPDSDEDRKELVAEFRDAHADLQRTVADLASFDELIRHLKRAIRQTQVQEVNTRVGETPAIDWAATYGHILVGGQAMDRGFTVEGLTVTYMPRSLGVGNADNVQQRARFLGYKRSYLGYCRVFLGTAAKSAYERYVRHEEDIRGRLEAHLRTGKPLTEWKREFFLTSQLKPTRRSVLGLDYVRTAFGDEWWYPESPHEADLDVNRKVVADFIASLNLVPDSGDPNRTDFQKHLVDENVSLAKAFDELLTQYTVAALDDSQRFTTLRILIQDHIEENPDALCSVYEMSGGKSRERKVDKDESIVNLLQGPHPDANGAIYPGDRRIRRPEGVTIQIHNVEIKEPDDERIQNVPTIAVWIPGSIAQDLVIQPQPLPDAASD
jgi:Z1 domain